MSNSKLVTYTKRSPNNSGKRKYEISRITIHHMAGVLTAEQCGAIFANPARQASSNYGVDYKAKVALYVDENKRSWATSNADNDNRAITIEVSNNKTGGKWTVSDKVLNKLIDLCVDICKRNGKTKAIWFGDKKKSLSYKPKKNEIVLTVHRWFAPTACPGDYLMSKMPYIAKEINKRIQKNTNTKKTAESVKYKVVQKSGMNIRQKPSTSGKIIGVMPYGKSFVATDKKASGDKEWVYASGYKGWVCRKQGNKTYLKKV